MRKPNRKQVAAAQREAQRWAQGLEAMAASIGRHFARAEARERAGQYLRGLLAPVERKNGWQLAEALGDASPYGVQHLLGRAEWEADAVRDDLRAYVTEHLGDPQAVVVLDETGFVKKGTKSAGVQRQYSGTAGRIENCQIGVFLGYASARGHALIDRALYLPRVWAEDAPRRAAAGVPAAIGFATKGQLARQMLERAVRAEIPFAWVTADEVYGEDRALRLWLESEGIAHVMAVRSNSYVWAGLHQQQVATLVKALPRKSWSRLSCGKGAKGERRYDWALVPLLSVGIGGWQRYLLVRRQIDEPKELAYYVVFAPKRTGLKQLVRVAGTRWAIEESFERAKGEVGLDQYEVRSWHGWYRHITLALLAHAFLTVMRAASLAQSAAGAPRRSPRAEKKAHTATTRLHPARGTHSPHRARGAAAAVVADLPHRTRPAAGAGLVPLATASPSHRQTLSLSA